MSLAELVHGRGNPVYLLQPPDVRAASQGRRKHSLDCFAPNALLCATRSALAKTGGGNALGARDERWEMRGERWENIDEYAFSHLYFLISHLYKAISGTVKRVYCENNRTNSSGVTESSIV